MKTVSGTLLLCGLMLAMHANACACANSRSLVTAELCMPVLTAQAKADATKRPAKAGRNDADRAGAPRKKDASPALNMDALIERLKKTDAIGFFTKLAIRNDVMDFTAMVKRYRRQAVLKARIQDVRARFEGLFLKIVALLEKDPALSRDIYLARENIWKHLVEEKA